MDEVGAEVLREALGDKGGFYYDESQGSLRWLTIATSLEVPELMNLLDEAGVGYRADAAYDMGGSQPHFAYRDYLGKVAGLNLVLVEDMFA